MSLILRRKPSIVLEPKIFDQTAGTFWGISLRLLSSKYTGPCMRVARQSDQAEQDIYFDSEGKIDIAELKTFLEHPTYEWGKVTRMYVQNDHGMSTWFIGRGQHASDDFFATGDHRNNEIVIDDSEPDVGCYLFLGTYFDTEDAADLWSGGQGGFGHNNQVGTNYGYTYQEALGAEVYDAYREGTGSAAWVTPLSVNMDAPRAGTHQYELFGGQSTYGYKALGEDIDSACTFMSQVTKGMSPTGTIVSSATTLRTGFCYNYGGGDYQGIYNYVRDLASTYIQTIYGGRSIYWRGDTHGHLWSNDNYNAILQDTSEQQEVFCNNKAVWSTFFQSRDSWDQESDPRIWTYGKIGPFGSWDTPRTSTSRQIDFQNELNDRQYYSSQIFGGYASGSVSGRAYEFIWHRGGEIDRNDAKLIWLDQEDFWTTYGEFYNEDNPHP